MRKILLSLLLFIVLKAQAQDDRSVPSLGMAAGYSHEFPGLNGYTLAAEYNLVSFSAFEGAMGIKYTNLNGYPRTTQINEFTRAYSVDFIGYWLALEDGPSQVRIGMGYSFSVFSIQRSYPTYPPDSLEKTATWHPQAAKGTTSGPDLILSYQYGIAHSGIFLGLRAAIYKAYKPTYFLGPTLGLNW
jgi:hypothetical protein